jgi:hypothetical protein
MFISYFGFLLTPHSQHLNLLTVITAEIPDPEVMSWSQNIWSMVHVVISMLLPLA